MNTNERNAVSKLIQNNTSHLSALCNEFSQVSDTSLEQLIQTHIQDNIRIIQKLKAML